MSETSQSGPDRARTALPAQLSDRIRLRWIVVMASTTVLLLATLVVRNRGLWAPDELRYAQIVQRMNDASDMFVLRLWDNIYTEKPPLFFWLARAFAPLTGGVYLTTLLGPVVISSCLLLWLTGCMARKWYGTATASIAVLVLVTLPLFLLLSSIGRMDMLLALFVTAAVFGCFRGYAEDSAACRVWAYVWMGLGLLAKGPFGIIFPLATAATALTISGKGNRLWCRETCYGLAFLAALMACWLVPAVSLAGMDYLEALIGKQMIERAVIGVDHSEPAYFYIWVLPIILLPWVVFLFPSLRASWRRWQQQRDERELWLLCWLGMPLVILSLVREKLPVYLLPAMPPIALLIGRYWRELFVSREFTLRLQFRIGWLFVLAAMIGLIALATSFLIVREPAEPGVNRLADLFKVSQQAEISRLILQPQTLCFGGAGLVILALVGWMAMRVANQGSLAWTFATLAAVAPCVQLFLIMNIMPALDAGLSWRAVAEAITAAQESGEPVITYGLRPFAAYYLSRDVTWFKRQNSLGDFVRRHGAAWCATREQVLDEIQRSCVIEHDPSWTYPSPSGPILLIRLRPLSVAGHRTR